MIIGGCARPLPGEEACGDAWVAVQHEHTHLVALCDGLGHGEPAAAAATVFCDFIKTLDAQHVTGMGLEMVMQNADRALRGTRGVVAALVRVDLKQKSVQLAGVGNIAMRLQGETRVTPVPLPGVIGMRFRRTKVFSYDVEQRLFVVLFSDGVSTRLDISTYADWPPQAAADAIVRDHGKPTDDASCVVVSYAT